MKIAITSGDPAGVGPEIIKRWLPAATATGAEFVVFGLASWLDSLHAPAGFELVPVGAEGFRATPGRPTAFGSEAALAAMEEAANGCRAGKFAAVVTGPVSKIEMQRVGFRFPGQSEFFADRWGGTPSMAFTGGRLRVVLATWHVPLREVPNHLTREALERSVRHAAWLARAEDCATPRIAVCGLNPHAGEDGMLGREEGDYLNPWLEIMRPQFPGLLPCQPGDTVFARALNGEFDVIVALYHDQGLAPLKAVDFDSAVNVTLGLSHIRTSPDHGTAFGITGRGIANTTSFENAVTAAVRLTKYRSAGSTSI
jgi:4-hydroxythreonine-4-phosphate dehydrogenase